MSNRAACRSRGFTLIELVIVLAIMMIIAMIGFPSLMTMVHRSRLETSVRGLATAMQIAKLEAIKSGHSAVVRIDAATSSTLAHVNIDDSTDYAYDPDPSKDYRKADYQLTETVLPAGIAFKGPGGSAERVDGFTTDPGGGDEIVIFQPNGSIKDDGAFRIGDDRGNFLEIRVSPKATARIELKKWDPGSSKWLAQGEEDKQWNWY